MEWINYSRQVGRFGVDRDDIHFGIVASAMAGGQPTKYMPYFDPLAADVTAEELLGKPPRKDG